MCVLPDCGQCSVLIRRLEHISSLACSLNVTDDFLSLVKNLIHCYQETTETWHGFQHAISFISVFINLNLHSWRLHVWFSFFLIDSPSLLHSCLLPATCNLECLSVIWRGKVTLFKLQPDKNTAARKTISLFFPSSLSLGKVKQLFYIKLLDL